MSQWSDEIGSGSLGGPAQPEPPSAGVPADLLRRLRLMIASPGEAFRPPLSKWVWIAPLVLLSIWAFFQWYLSSDLVLAEGMASNPDSAAALEGLPEGKLGGFRLVIGIGALFMTWVGYLVPAAFFWLGLNFVLGGKAGFGAVFAVTVFTAIVLVPRDILLTVLRLRAGAIHPIYTSPAVLLDAEQKPLIAMAEHLDLFALYRLVLLAFGFRAISGLKGKQVAWMVCVLWLLSAAFAAGMSALGQRFGS
jgi:hypothetical protein